MDSRVKQLLYDMGVEATLIKTGDELVPAFSFPADKWRPKNDEAGLVVGFTARVSFKNGTFQILEDYKQNAILAMYGTAATFTEHRFCAPCARNVTPNTYKFGDRTRDFCPTCGTEVTE
jgi:hypothetical protein